MFRNNKVFKVLKEFKKMYLGERCFQTIVKKPSEPIVEKPIAERGEGEEKQEEDEFELNQNSSKDIEFDESLFDS